MIHFRVIFDDGQTGRAGCCTHWCDGNAVLCWRLDLVWLHMTTGSSSWTGRGALTCGVVGSVGGTLPRRSVRRSSSGGASWTPAIVAVRHVVVWRIQSVAVMVGTGMT